jgi:hypothetical protein
VQLTAALNYSFFGVQYFRKGVSISIMIISKLNDWIIHLQGKLYGRHNPVTSILVTIAAAILTGLMKLLTKVAAHTGRR